MGVIMKVIRLVPEAVVEFPETCPQCGCSVFAGPPLPDAEQLRFVANAEGTEGCRFDSCWVYSERRCNP
jgi:hypothetical protein